MCRKSVTSIRYYILLWGAGPRRGRRIYSRMHKNNNNKKQKTMGQPIAPPPPTMAFLVHLIGLGNLLANKPTFGLHLLHIFAQFDPFHHQHQEVEEFVQN